VGGEAAEIDVQAHLEQPKREQHGPHRGRGPLSGGRGRRLVVGPGRARRVDRAAEEADRKRLVSACIGVPHAEKLFSWLRIYRQVDASRIIRKGQPVDFTTGTHADPSFVYAATYAVAAWLRTTHDVTDAQLPNVVRFLRSPGLDAEYAFLCMRQVRRNEALFDRLKGLPAFRELAGELVSLSASLYA
jgi:hypothetical protein